MPARAEVFVVEHYYHADAELKRKGFNRDKRLDTLKVRAENDISSYLGEFILGARFKEFYYEEIIDPQTGQRGIGAPGFIGDIGKSYEGAIQDAQRRGFSGRREIAESEAFNKKLNPQLLNAPAGTFYIWVSPPGSKEEGYGDYSFTHLGQVQETATGRRRYVVTSLRNTLELDDHAAMLNHFLPEGKKLKNPNDIDFLSSPILIANEGNHTIHDLLVAIDVILKQERKRTTHFAQAYQEREDWEKKLLESLGPMIDDYCLSVVGGASKADSQKIIWAMENYTRESTVEDITFPVREGTVSRRELEAAIIYQRYGYQPATLAGGGCSPGSSNPIRNSLTTTATLPWQEHKLENFRSSEGKKTLECTCPNCQQKVKAVIENGKIHCPACGAAAPYKC